MSKNDNGSGDNAGRRERCEAASTLPLQLGKKMREVFADDPASAPMPDRLQELLEELAARELEQKAR